MTREEHLKFCKRCLNRKMDFNQGIVCDLSGQIAAFEKECPDFSHDKTVTVILDDEVHLERSEIKNKLSTDTFERLRLEQNLIGAIVVGLSIAVLCAVLWGAFTVSLEFQISYMALLVGAAVGYGMRKVGKGVDLIFGIFGGGISLFGCMLGNFFSLIGFIASTNQLGYFETLTRFDYNLLPDVMKETFDIRDIVFYVVAVVTGFKLAQRKITAKDLEVIKEQNKR